MKIEDIRQLIPQICDDIVRAGGVEEVAKAAINNVAKISDEKLLKTVKEISLSKSKAHIDEIQNEICFRATNWDRAIIRKRLERLVEDGKLKSNSWNQYLLATDEQQSPCETVTEPVPPSEKEVIKTIEGIMNGTVKFPPRFYGVREAHGVRWAVDSGIKKEILGKRWSDGVDFDMEKYSQALTKVLTRLWLDNKVDQLKFGAGDIGYRLTDKGLWSE